MIGKLVCWITRKHLRGVRMEGVSSEKVAGLNAYRCRRCCATWTRKAKKPAKLKAVANG